MKLITKLQVKLDVSTQQSCSKLQVKLDKALGEASFM